MRGKEPGTPRPLAHGCCPAGGGLGTCEGHVRKAAGVFPEGEPEAWPRASPGLRPAPCPGSDAVPLPSCCRRTSWVSPRASRQPLLTASSSRHFAFFFFSFQSLCNRFLYKYNFNSVASAWFLRLWGWGRGIVALGTATSSAVTFWGAIFGKTCSSTGL